MLPAVWCLATPQMMLNCEYAKFFTKRNFMVRSSSAKNAKIMLLENLGPYGTCQYICSHYLWWQKYSAVYHTYVRSVMRADGCHSPSNKQEETTVMTNDQSPVGISSNNDDHEMLSFAAKGQCVNVHGSLPLDT